MTDTARTIDIVERAPAGDAEAIRYFLDLPTRDRALFDNATDFLVARMAMRGRT